MGKEPPCLSLLFFGREAATRGKHIKTGVAATGEARHILLASLLDDRFIQSWPGLFPQTGHTLFWLGLPPASIPF
jgi:hypothetical protein